jgi:hypothetical protein
MKALIYKEFRENLKLAVPVFLLLAMICWFAAWDGRDNALLGDESLRIFSIGCALFGAALGWSQIHNERPRDLWAFLVHRPVTRTEIFFAKIIVGLLIYFLAVSLPLLGYLIWISIPGHLGAPFEWGTALPASGWVLLGPLWYFAAMLTSLREARWYASRGMALAAVLPVQALALKMPGLPLFWQFELAIGLLTAALALAVWGSFQTTGGYPGQPLRGKAALAGVMALGTGVVVLVAVAFLANVLHQPGSQAYYALTKAGSIFRVVTRNNEPAVITDLTGARLKDAKTGANIELEEFNRELPRQYQVSVSLGDLRIAAYALQQPCDFFYVGWREVDGIVWDWTRQGQLAGYEARTHRFVGRLGPRGLFKDSASSDEEFLRPGFGGHQISPRTLATSHSVYELDLRNRATRPIFTTLADDRILGTRDVSDSATIIVTKQFIQMVDTEGKILCQFPHDPQYREPGSITVFPLESRDQFVLWIYPSRLQSQSLEGKVRREMVRISGGEVGPKIELQPPDPPRPADERIDDVLSFFVSPEFPFIKPLLFRLSLLHVPIQWKLVKIAMFSAALCAMAGWLIGRRYRFGVQAQFGWVLFHLLAGFPGLLAFLCVREWPAREACPACKQPRLVDRERCEHCGAHFLPPEKTGTEIFAPLNYDRTEGLIAGTDPKSEMRLA